MPERLFDPYSPAFLADPYPVYDDLPDVFHDARWNLTFFRRYQDVSGLLKDRRLGRDFHHRLSTDQVDLELYLRTYPQEWPNWTKYIRGSFIDLEPPRHTRIRRLVAKAFTRRHAEEFRPLVEALASRLLDEAVARGGMEVIADYATPIPIALIAELMAIPRVDHDRLLDWSHLIVKVFDEKVTVEEGNAAEAAVVEFTGYLSEVIEQRRHRPGNDLVSSLITSEEDGDRLALDDLVATCILTLNAGHEATVHAIGNALLALSRHPAEFARLRREASLTGSAAAELLRFDSPLQMFERWVLEDLDWNGHRLEQGTKVGLLFGAANRDERRFPDPDRLDLGRADNQHLAFGAGIHRCVGEPLALVELEVAIGAVAKRVRELHLVTEELPRLESLVFRGVRELPLTLA